MIKDIKAIVARSQSTLLMDALGAVSLVAMLVGSLHIPQFV